MIYPDMDLEVSSKVLPQLSKTQQKILTQEVGTTSVAR